MNQPQLTAANIVYRDSDLLVLNKPSGLPTTSPDGERCLTSCARELDPDAERLHASSRLDADVTGLVTFARTTRAIAALTAARAAGSYRRFYLGLASQLPDAISGEWRWAIARDPREPRRRIALPEHTAKADHAHTLYTVLGKLEPGALLSMRPQTGRTHQLRVHAARAGVALFGDKHYGGPIQLVQSNGRVLRAARVMLHCARLELPGIASQAELVVEAPLPSDMRDLFAALGGSDAWLDPATFRRA
jgi:23S rRNA-/tRNA-specific pseudouridylate synthase